MDNRAALTRGRVASCIYVLHSRGRTVAAECLGGNGVAWYCVNLQFEGTERAILGESM